MVKQLRPFTLERKNLKYSAGCNEIERFCDGGNDYSMVMCKCSHVLHRPHSDTCDIVLRHESTSRQHAAIIHSRRGVHLVDLKSSHGTFLNDVKIRPGEPVLLHSEWFNSNVSVKL